MGAERDARADPRECAPVLSVSDVAASLSYYCDVLGFDEAFRWGEPLYYAGVCRGAVALHLTSAEERRAHRGLGILSLFVEDADVAHRELAARGANVTVEIADRPYGMRDFMVEDPDGNQLAWGSPLDAES